MTAQQFYQKWRKKILCHRIGYIEFEPAEAFEFAEAYAAERVKELEAELAKLRTQCGEENKP